MSVNTIFENREKDLFESLDSYYLCEVQSYFKNEHYGIGDSPNYKKLKLLIKLDNRLSKIDCNSSSFNNFLNKIKTILLR